MTEIEFREGLAIGDLIVVNRHQLDAVVRKVDTQAARIADLEREMDRWKSLRAEMLALYEAERKQTEVMRRHAENVKRELSAALARAEKAEVDSKRMDLIDSLPCAVTLKIYIGQPKADSQMKLREWLDKHAETLRSQAPGQAERETR